MLSGKQGCFITNIMERDCSKQNGISQNRWLKKITEE